jgi:proliferating cell nuclear antigen
MFSAKVKADVLKSIIEAASPLVSEVKLNIKTDGISFRAVDSAHVAMIDLNVSSKAFEEYKADEMELGVDLDKLNGILRLASSNDIVSLEYDEEAHRLVIRIGNLVRRMGLIDTAGMPDPKVPNLNLPSKVIIKSNELSQGIKASQAISDHVALSVDPDGFELYAEGDTDTVNLRLPKDLLSELQAPQKCRSLFSIDYFSNMIKPVKGEEDVTIFLGDDNPVKLEFDFADKNGHVTYLLAPRIESE